MRAFHMEPRVARHVWRAVAVAVTAFVVVTGLAAWGLDRRWPVHEVVVHVRWTAGVTDAERVGLEARLRLRDAVSLAPRTWRYRLADWSAANIAALVRDPRVEDTEHVNRTSYRPSFAQDRPRRIAVYAVAAGGLAAVLLTALVVFGRVAWLRAGSAWLAAAVRPDRAAVGWWSPAPSWRAPFPPVGVRTAIALLLAAGLLSGAAAWGVGAALASLWAALLVVYGGGYVVGALLAPDVDGPAAAVIRAIAGLLLTTIGFLFSLVLGLPWYAGPCVLFVLALGVRGGSAAAWPRMPVRFRVDHAAAGLLAAVLLAPIAISYVYMAPGPYPPVLYNVDMAYFLEKVHALHVTDVFPPESLGNAGVRRSYHYGTQAMAALVSRASGLAPHHAVFVVVLPLLTVGLAAGAFAVARHVCPALPRAVTVPLLLVSTPSLSRAFWPTFARQLGDGFASWPFSLDAAVGDYALWGMLSNEGQNVGGDFVVLASVAGIAAAPVWGRAIAAFLVGSAVLVKTPLGVALAAGVALVEAWRAVARRRFWPSPQAVGAAGVFLVVFVTFFWLSFESVFFVEWFPLYHLGIVADRDLAGFAVDLLWLCLPILIVATAGLRDPERRSVPVLLLALGPLLVANATRIDNRGPGGGASGDDWLQVLHAVPILVHVFALSLASRRWSSLTRHRRAAFLAAVVVATAPVVVAAGRYSAELLRDREQGNDFVDNRSMAAALSVVPTRGTLVVTNDLRYPADNFARNDRQIQIPALFGHRAFAVNYSYEPVEERRPLQALLQQAGWSDAILEAARTHGWTHLIVRKDYPHPDPIPLDRIFENADYAVFRFP